MEIIIIGDGKVGYTLARQLDQEGHNITIIEEKNDILEHTVNSLDVTGVCGSGTNIEVLRKAGVRHADLLIAATSADETNIVCCLMGKKLGASSTIARVRSPQYFASSWLFRDELGLSMLMNPEQAAATEIIRKLRFSSRISLSSFAKGRMELAGFRVTDESPLAYETIAQYVKNHPHQVLFCIVQRSKKALIPTGDTCLVPGDFVYVTGRQKPLQHFFHDVGLTSKKKVKEVMIVGASRIAWYLVPRLLDLGLDVKIIEKNQKKAEEMAVAFPLATVICGDGTDQELLMSENLPEMDAFVSLTDNDEENVIVCMFASAQGISNVIPKVNRVELGFLLEKLGLSNGITPKNIAADNIVQYVRAMQNSAGSNVESIIRAADDQIEILEFVVKENCRFIGIPVKDLPLKPGILVAYITHKGRPEVATGNSVARVGDTFIVVSRVKGLRDINDVLI